MSFRHSRWSLNFCRRSLSLQVFSWFWSLLCRKQLHGSRSFWNSPKKIPFRCTSRVNRCWLKTWCWPKGWQTHHYRPSNIHTWKLWEPSIACESHWARFVSFCRSKRWHMFRVRSHHYSTYMMHLFRDGLLPSTIISHRTSVASVLRHWLYVLAADPHIKLLIRAFRLEHPVQCRIMPRWDLHLVLLALMRPPFTLESGERNFRWRHSIKMADHENSFPVSIGFSETTFLHSCFECRCRQVCVLERKHPAPTGGFCFAGTWVSRQESGGWGWGRGVSRCLYIGTATSEISWQVISADGSWRQTRKLTHELRESTTELQHMRSELCQHHGPITVRWRYLTFCQLRFGGRQESFKIPIYETWRVSLMGCLHWVQWWSHSKSGIQDIFSHLHSLHDLYVAAATTFLMKITWLLAGIFMYGTE